MPGERVSGHAVLGLPYSSVVTKGNHGSSRSAVTVTGTWTGVREFRELHVHSTSSGARHRCTHGGPCCQEGMANSPGDAACVAGGWAGL